MSTVRRLTDVGIMETKTTSFSHTGPDNTYASETTQVPCVYTNVTDDGKLNCKVFNFGSLGQQQVTGQIGANPAEIALGAFTLHSDPSLVAGSTVSGAGTTAHQMIGKQIFARHTHLSICLRYYVPADPYYTKFTPAPAAGDTPERNVYGSAAWYTPIQYRILLVKFKRDKWPLVGAPKLDADATRFYPEGFAQTEAPRQCRQSPLNRALFMTHKNLQFGVGNPYDPSGPTPQAINEPFLNYMAFSQPVCRKWFEVIHEKKGWLHPSPVIAKTKSILTAGAPTGVQGDIGAGWTDAAEGALGQVFPLNRGTNLQSSKGCHKEIKLTLPWNEAFTMAQQNGNDPSFPQFQHDNPFLYPSDMNLSDVKLVMLFDRPAFNGATLKTQHDLMSPNMPPPAAGANQYGAEFALTPRVAVQIQGVSTYTDA